MKGILQYCATVDGTYKNVGTLRSIKKGYKVEPITGKSRLDEPEPAAYRVKVSALCLLLNTDFLDYTSWFFRVGFFDPDEMDMIELGSHKYTVDYDARLNTNTNQYHNVKLNFTIDHDEYEDYAIPVTLPASEGGIIIDDDDIYLE